MRIFALETDTNKIVKRYCSADESVLHVTHYHGMLFVLRLVKHILFAMPIILIASSVIFFGGPILITSLASLAAVCLFNMLPICKAWIDWKYDFIMITSDKVVLIDQSSIIKHHIKPIHFENIGSISLESQWFNMFNFGIVHIDLKEGEGGGSITKSFVPNATKFTEVLSNSVTDYQRGRPTTTDEATARFTADHQVQQRLERIQETFEQVTKPSYEQRKQAEFTGR